MELIYTCKNGLYHDKPCVDGNPSSNDGLIFTAYAKKLGLPVNMALIESFWSSLNKGKYFPIERLPGKKTPYPSRDFFLGAKYLDLINSSNMEFASWNFSPVELPGFNLLKTIASFVLAIGEHRNFLWQKELIYSYEFMFSVPLVDRSFHYIGSKSCPFHYWAISWIDKNILRGSSPSGKLIRWLKYDIDPGEESFIYMFGNNHPFTIEYRKKKSA